VEPVACRAQLAHFLTEEAALLHVLEQQLQNEHGLLTKNDIDGLENACAARQESVARLLRLDDERRGLCRLLGRGEDQAALSQLLQWCDPQGTLASAYEKCSLQATRCREQNDRNGALVGARLNRVSNMLGMLNTGGEKERVYNPQASGRGTAFKPGRLVSISA
jgi:flagellar biosynthesis/type III secretory pathway chaperone